MNPRKTKGRLIQIRLLVAVAVLALPLVAQAANLSTNSSTTTTSIPWSQIGAKAAADYHGDGLAVMPTASGARLHCVFQRLDGEATREGLWLTSTVTNTVADRFQVKATAMGRISRCAPGVAGERSGYQETALPATTLPAFGIVSIDGHIARFNRPGLVEEYSVSLDGVRQDFLVTEKSPGTGELQVRLAVSGAQVAQTSGGAELLLAKSGRKIAYSRMRVTDATGRELQARIEVADDHSGVRWQAERDTAFASPLIALAESTARGSKAPSPLRSASAFHALRVVVDDTEAVYPVEVDPTFSDANWVSLGGIPGADSDVYATTVDGSGNLCIGGLFTVVGDTNANYIAQWNGSSWSALGSGMNNTVHALAVSGGTLYAGGYFTTAGGSAANYIAQWNGTSWSTLSSGMNSNVNALTVSGGTLYAGGGFTTAGGSAANAIAQWNGSSWSTLGSGMNSNINALTVSGGTL
ncbi:MAG TPA: hypothetical protein VN281_18810, partial [Verrucomicrobiae bacterium]|nr:hypothetical protein [Verrucomicrobiae bacterium]